MAYSQGLEEVIPDSITVLYIENLQQISIDSPPLIDSTAAYNLIHSTQLPYSEFYTSIRDSVMTIRSNDSRALNPPYQSEENLAIIIAKLNPLGILLDGDVSVGTRGRGQYLIVENRIILQHGGQTSWGMKTTSHYEAVSEE